MGVALFLGIYHDEYYDVYISLRHIDQLYVMTLVGIYLTDFTQGNRQSSQIGRRSCDAGLSLSEKIFCSKSQEYPTLGKARISPSPLGLELIMEDLVASGLRSPRITPPQDWNFSC